MIDNNNQHPVDQIPYYIAGKLPGEERTAVELHLMTCADCRTQVEEWRLLAEVVQIQAKSRVRRIPTFNTNFVGAQRAAASLNGKQIEPIGENMTTFTPALEKRAQPSRQLLTFAATLALFLLMTSIFIVRLTPNSGLPSLAVQNPFDQLTPITPENAADLQQIGQIGKGAISNIAWSPDNSTLAVATVTGVYLHSVDAPEGQQLGTASGFVNALTYSPDGQTIAVLRNLKLEIWDAETGEILRTLDADNRYFGNPEFTPDGTRLLVQQCSEPPAENANYCEIVNIGILDLETDEFTAVVSEAAVYVTHKALSRDGEQIAISTVSEDNQLTLRVWKIADIEAGNLEGTLVVERERERGFVYITFSPDGEQIAAMEGSHMYRWEIESGKLIGGTILASNTIYFKYRSDGEAVQYLSYNGSDADYTFNVRQLNGAIMTSGSIGADFMHWTPTALISHDDHYLVTVQYNGTIHLWDIEDAANPERIAQIDDYSGQADRITFAPQGTALAFVTQIYTEVWDYEADERLARVDKSNPYGGWSGSAMDFTPDNRLYYSETIEDNTYRPVLGVWEAESGTSSEFVFQDRGGSVRTLEADADGNLTLLVNFIEGQKFGIVRRSAEGKYSEPVMLRPESTDAETSIMNNSLLMDTLKFSPDGKVLALAQCFEYCQKAGLLLFDAETGEQLLALDDEDFTYYGTFRPTFSLVNGRYLLGISGCVESESRVEYGTQFIDCIGSVVKVWDITALVAGETNEAEVVFSLEMNDVFNGLLFNGLLAFSPDGRLLAATMPDVAVFDLKSGEMLNTLTGHRWTQSLAFNDDGILLAVGGAGVVSLYGVGG